MPATFLTDGTLSLNEQAIGVLKRLKKVRVDQLEGYDTDLHIRVKDFAWYNGRECGVSVVLQRSGENLATTKHRVPRILTVIFGECRRTDGIFIEYWNQSSEYFNSPVVGCNPEEAYQNRQTIDPEQYDRAVAIICDLISQWFLGTLPVISKTTK